MWHPCSSSPTEQLVSFYLWELPPQKIHSVPRAALSRLAQASIGKMNHYDNHDVEKGAATQETFDKDGSRFNKVDGDLDGSGVSNEDAVAGESFEIGNGWYARAQRLAGKLKIEQRGIERVPEDERTDAGFKALLNVATMWLSANVSAISMV